MDIFTLLLFMLGSACLGYVIGSKQATKELTKIIDQQFASLDKCMLNWLETDAAWRKAFEVWTVKQKEDKS